MNHNFIKWFLFIYEKHCITMKIYTKTGDSGTTMLFGGDRVAKHHVRIEAYGTVDELNSFIGLIRELLNEKKTKEILEEIQNRLFTVGSVLASSPNKDNLKTPDLLEADVELLEQEMDRMEANLPGLTNFVLPGGLPAASYCHIARCVCRRAERRVTHLIDAEPDTVPNIVVRYLNRLSDYLFVLSRKTIFDSGGTEIIWNTRK